MKIVLTVNRSNISGMGIFAGTMIPASTILFRSFEVYGKYIFELLPNNFVNHSTSPNLETVLVNGIPYKKTLRTIAPGEELTSDYNQTNRALAPLGITPATSNIITDFGPNSQADYDNNRTAYAKAPAGTRYEITI